MGEIFLGLGDLVATVVNTQVAAYIDPSAVTYIIQGVAGVIIALGAALAVFRHKIFKFLRGKKKENEQESKIEFKDVE